MTEYQTWHEYLIQRLAADREKRVSYLDVALEEYQEDGDTPFFLIGLQNVIESQGGISEVAKKIDIAPQCLSDVLSSEEAPRLDTLNTILQALGCRLSIQPLKDMSSSLHHADENYPVTPKESTDPNLEVTTDSNDFRST
jgi:DNA-binding phage protein